MDDNISESAKALGCGAPPERMTQAAREFVVEAQRRPAQSAG
jgi:hypothetical protein